MFPSKIGSYSGTSVASSNLVAEVATVLKLMMGQLFL